jgi:hypothetical protein
MPLNPLHFEFLQEQLKPTLKASILRRYGSFLEQKELEHLTGIGMQAIRRAAEKANDELLTPEAAIPKILDAMNRAISDEFFSNGQTA